MAPFFVDNAAFGIDFSRFEAQGAGPVVEYQQAAVLYRCAGNRYVRYVVYGFIEAGVCVQVVPEFDSDGLKVVDDSLSGEILSAVEAHMFKEVGEAALVVFFEHGAYFLSYVEIGLSLWAVVVADIVGEPVVEVAYADLRIFRHCGELAGCLSFGCACG